MKLIQKRSPQREDAMKTIVLSLLAGTMFGAITATALFTYAQSPDWYNNTSQGQWQRQRDILEPQMQQDLRDRPLPPYSTPWRPC
jgi:hypothetical protein